MKILIIYNSKFPLATSLLSSTGLGGTETNIIQLSQKFSEQADVTLACAHQYSPFLDGKVRNIPLELLEDDLQHNPYDFILIQCFYRDVVKLIEQSQPMANVFIFHSLNYINQHSGLLNNDYGHELVSNYMTDEELQSPVVKKFIALSESQKNEYHIYNKIPIDKIEIVPNGIDMSLFSSDSADRRPHSIIWSSNISRGLDILVKSILPLIKRRHQDVSLQIACPSYAYRRIAIPEHLKDNIVVLGPLPKKDLYREISKSQVWFYPSTFNETFCITSIEMALGEVELVLPLKNGPATIFRDFADIGMKHDASDGAEFINEAVHQICDRFYRFYDSDRILRRKAISQHIRANYSYNAICGQYFDLLKRL